MQNKSENNILFRSGRSANHEIFTKECVMYLEKDVLDKKFTKERNMGSPRWARDEKTVHGVWTQWLSGKEKVPGSASIK